jgi:hypothetical protein
LALPSKKTINPQVLPQGGGQALESTIDSSHWALA